MILRPQSISLAWVKGNSMLPQNTSELEHKWGKTSMGGKNFQTSGALSSSIVEKLLALSLSILCKYKVGY